MAFFSDTVGSPDYGPIHRYQDRCVERPGPAACRKSLGSWSMKLLPTLPESEHGQQEQGQAKADGGNDFRLHSRVGLFSDFRC